MWDSHWLSEQVCGLDKEEECWHLEEERMCGRNGVCGNVLQGSVLHGGERAIWDGERERKERKREREFLLFEKLILSFQ